MRYAALIQGFYFICIGLWPVIDSGSFMLVTGPEADIWLLKAQGFMLVVAGLVLFSAGMRGKIYAEMYVLGLLLAMGLTGIDVYYCMKDVISRIYLFDAALEFIFILMWMSSIQEYLKQNFGWGK